MSASRKIERIFQSRSTIEGAGVHLKRAFGRDEAPLFDPFLMLDDFRSSHSEHYIKGFPWHPHRGIETITYVLKGDVELAGGARGRIICGSMEGVKGPVRDVVTDPEYIDISLPPNARYMHPTKAGHTVLAYVISGAGFFGADNRNIRNEGLVKFGEGDKVTVVTADEPVRFLLLSGKPVGEPVAWYGPIVMNTREELETAFREYDTGNFIRHKAA